MKWIYDSKRINDGWWEAQTAEGGAIPPCGRIGDAGVLKTHHSANMHAVISLRSWLVLPAALLPLVPSDFQKPKDLIFKI